MKRVMTAMIVMVWAVPCPIFAHILNVPAQYATIQAGIDASANGDTVLVAPGTYHERINFNGHACILASLFLLNGDTSSIGETIIDGDAAGSVVTFDHSESSTSLLIGFTVRNGRTVNGSGVNCIGAGPTIRNNIITANTSTSDAGIGGGIGCENNSNAIIESNWIIGNRAGYGAGIGAYNSSPLIDRNFIFGNVAPSGEIGGNGGGICCMGSSSPIIVANEIRYDSAFWSGGGIACFGDAQAVITGNTISENYGCGVQLGLGHSILRGNVISGNTSQHVGGGVLCNDFSGEISNNIIAGNMAPDDGAAIYYNSEQFAPSLANNVIFGNTSGIYFHGTGLTVVNSICWRNDAYEIRLYSGSTASVTYCDIQGGWTGMGNIDVDPLFRDTTYVDFHLQSTACGDPHNSPCIDAGNPDSLDAEFGCHAGLATSRADMGAYGGGGNLTGINNEKGVIPSAPLLTSNYPNPFNAQTTIRFSLPEAGTVTLDIYDILGRKIESAFTGSLPAGGQSVVWDAGGNPSGVYFFLLETAGHSQTGKATLIK